MSNDRWISRPDITWIPRMELAFPTSHGRWFGFPCDEQGKVDVSSLEEGPRKSYEECVSGKMAELSGPPYIRRWEEKTWVDGEFRCDCGRTFKICPCGHDFSCRDCGRNFNSSGSLLAPVEQWGEETGEHYADVARSFPSLGSI